VLFAREERDASPRSLAGLMQDVFLGLASPGPRRTGIRLAATGQMGTLPESEFSANSFRFKVGKL
jgi:hypothetical protein